MPMKNNREYRDMILTVVADQDGPEEERDEKKTSLHCQPKEADPIDWDEVTRLAYQIHEEGGTA